MPHTLLLRISCTASLKLLKMEPAFQAAGKTRYAMDNQIDIARYGCKIIASRMRHSKPLPNIKGTDGQHRRDDDRHQRYNKIPSAMGAFLGERMAASQRVQLHSLLDM
ncbi:hypothetical protein [uncultured Bartonella sp.]|uniref:hypothetical protein n=1 Tax=uncultured Bartonella sp. TaxID=104108 RepID=UPI002602FFB9|nr:hypothetical protein [uncultured Bartonella sp.]